MDERDPDLSDGEALLEGFDLDDDDAWMKRVRQAETRPAAGSIGEYEVLEEIGRGGQGVVYRARQPGMRRDVALKRLFSGPFGSESSRQRFEREVEAVSRLNHPRIVTVYGTEVIDGAPVLSMEWIDGVSVTEWAKTRVGTRSGGFEVVEMAASIAEALRHAHQRGVIHRDLKPSNVLVDRDDEPHVLDFGLAKLTGPDTAGMATITQPEQFVGTVAYASPEQVHGRTEAIDVRTDVYALGTMLYEMLTGRTPFDPGSSLPDLFKAIAEKEPARPSSIAAGLDRDLEAIVMKAMAKEPDRRYQSMDAFLDDLRRYVAGEAVRAHPPRTMYVLGKTLRRHRWPFAFAATLFVVLTVFAIVTAGQAARIARERDSAVAAGLREADQREIAEVINEFLRNMLVSADPEVALGREVTVREVLEDATRRVESDFAGRPLVEASVRDAIGSTYLALGRHDEARTHLARALELRGARLGPRHPDTLSSMNVMGVLLEEVDEGEEATDMLRRAVAGRRDVLGADDADTIESTINLAGILSSRGRVEEAEALTRLAVEVAERTLGREDRRTFGALNALVVLLAQQGRPEEAVAIARRLAETARRVQGLDHPQTLVIMNNLGTVLTRSGELEEAEGLHREALEAARRVFGPGHLRTLAVLSNLGSVLMRQGKLDGVEDIAREILQIRTDELGIGHRETLLAWNNLASLLDRLGRSEEAAREFERLIETADQELPAGDWFVAGFRVSHGRCLMSLERFEDAEKELLDGYRALRVQLDPTHPQVASARASLARLYETLGEPERIRRIEAPPAPGRGGS